MAQVVAMDYGVMDVDEVGPRVIIREVASLSTKQASY